MATAGRVRRVSCHDLLDADHELGAKRESVRVVFSLGHWASPAGFWLISAETPS